MLLLSQDREPFRLLSMQGMSDQDEADLFSFFGSVGPNGDNRREDVIRAQTLLRQTGDFDPDGIFPVPTGWPSSDLYRGIRKFQKRIGLDADGTLLPMPSGGVDANGVGETVDALRSTLGDSLAGRKAPTLAEVDAHYETDGRFRNTAADKDKARSSPMPAGHDGPQLAQASRTGQNATSDSGMTAAAPSPQPKPMPLPDFKKDFFAKDANRGVWNQSQSALQRQLPDSPALRGALGRIYAEEGGRIRDPNDTAVGGLTAGTLKHLQDNDLLPGLPKNASPQSLTPDQQITAYRAYLDQTMRHIGGAKALEALDPDFAHAIADAVFMHGSTGGMEAVQQAINQSGMDSSIKIDGGMGPKTFDALKRVNNDPALREALQNKIADVRENLKEWEPGELARIHRTRPGAWKR